MPIGGRAGTLVIVDTARFASFEAIKGSPKHPHFLERSGVDAGLTT